MILKTLLLFLALLPFSSPLQAGVWDNITGYFKGSNRPEPPTIRILLLHDVEGAKLEVRGKYRLFDPYTDSHLSTRFTGKSRYIQAVSDGLKWGESFPGLYQIKIKPDDASTTTLINNHEYEGLIYVYDIGGTISIVNQIPVEDYVRSVLIPYQNQYLEPETLAALAIVARTNAYFQAANPKNTYWAIDAEKVGYQGSIPGSYAVDDAVKLTRYMIMSRTGVYEGIATPFAAQFDALSGKQSSKDAEVSKISLAEANAMAQSGAHAAQILAKAFPGTTIMLMEYSK
jgi:stage II sporulation protein D